MTEQARMVAELRRARYGYLLAVHLLLLCAAGRTPSEIAAVLFCSRSSVYRVVKAYRAGTLTFDCPTAEAHVGFQGRGLEDGVNSSHPLSQPMAGVRACRSISKI